MNTTELSLKPQPTSFLRWTALLLISLAMMGNYYIYDSISPLADLLKAQLGFSDSNIGLLNAIYSFPNIIMVLVGGLVIDRIGTKTSVLIFTVLITLGSIVTAVTGNIWMMSAGRLIFGLGAESMIVAITTIIARWFKGKELSFAFGLNLTVARLGSFLALNSPSWGKSLYEYWQSPLWITVAGGVFALVCIALYFFLDLYASKNFNLPKEGEQDAILLSDILRVKEKQRWLIFSGIAALAIILTIISSDNWSIYLIVLIVGMLILFLKVKSFSTSFWYITALCVTFYSAMFPFQTFAIKFFQEAHGTSREVGGNLSSILTLAAMIFTPLFGLLADKIGKRSLLMMFGSLLIIPVYLMMAYQFGKPDVMHESDFVNITISFFDIDAAIPIYLILPMAMMGIAFSLVPAVMWPSVAIIVDQSKLGTAYGLMTMIQNIGLFSFNLLIGFANDFSGASAENPAGYNLGMWIFSILGFLGLLFAYLLRKSETGPKGHGLELGMKQKKS
ncbi:MAG: MFS transporter [Ignavibacteriota bacterium]|nr:MAG: MFS transporter [Chlorobiota bacterium]MBE7477354.1 MFS transporter [Ignavibacteriales bacterium]MBL1122755.1 MFS transporter [Ignavibacteriota bacterium]MCC7094484.1 MFS transporter [Ignavibacteriaceae bacterium]QKJ95025.1 MAG: MFS transporter [Ignavibacteriota bacterium]